MCFDLCTNHLCNQTIMFPKLSSDRVKSAFKKRASTNAALATLSPSVIPTVTVSPRVQCKKDAPAVSAFEYFCGMSFDVPTRGKIISKGRKVLQLAEVTLKRIDETSCISQRY